MTSPGGLGAQTWPELDERRCTLVVAVGAVEQHGPHLPLDTDARIAGAVAERGVDGLVAGAHADAVLAPALTYGASGEHEMYPGTVSIGAHALHMVLVEYGRSACRWASRVVFVNGHGGNVSTLQSAVALLRSEGRDVVWFACGVRGADAHAGETETSLLLHISPETVRTHLMAPGNTAPLHELIGTMRTGGVAAVSPSGVLGDPVGATAQRGRGLLDDMVTGFVSAVTRWSPESDGRLR